MVPRQRLAAAVFAAGTVLPLAGCVQVDAHMDFNEGKVTSRFETVMRADLLKYGGDNYDTSDPTKACSELTKNDTSPQDFTITGTLNNGDLKCSMTSPSKGINDTSWNGALSVTYDNNNKYTVDVDPSDLRKMGTKGSNSSPSAKDLGMKFLLHLNFTGEVDKVTVDNQEVKEGTTLHGVKAEEHQVTIDALDEGAKHVQVVAYDHKAVNPWVWALLGAVFLGLALVAWGLWRARYPKPVATPAGSQPEERPLSPGATVTVVNQDGTEAPLPGGGSTAAPRVTPPRS